MSESTRPKDIYFRGPGTFRLPNAVRCDGFKTPQGEHPEQIRFVLEDDTALCLPVTEGTLKQLYAAMKAYFGETEPPNS